MSTQKLSLTLIPPSPVSDAIVVSIRAGIRTSVFYATGLLRLKINGEILCEKSVSLAPDSCFGISADLSTKDKLGDNTIEAEFVPLNAAPISQTEPLRVIHTGERSIRMLSGAWSGITHWSEQEGKFWNADIRKLTDAQWRGQIRGMRRLGLDIMVIQETWRNQEYYGKHRIPEEGYKGRAYYHSSLYPGRMDIRAENVLETILDEADKQGIKVFPGVGAYAWFDYTPDSLEWHKKVVTELYERFGHHKSFYGFYVSEEIAGDLGGTEKSKAEIIGFFKKFTAFCRGLAPEKPVMLAPNSHYIHTAEDGWKELLKHLDILCPFAFHRMNPDDLPPEEAARRFQSWCDEAGCHLWLDMELFLFDPANALYPRPLSGLLDDLYRFPNFEKILGYQYQGLMTDPEDSVKLGGERAVKLFEDYQRYYLKTKKQYGL